MEKNYSITIVGGGSTWTPGLLKALVACKARFPLRKLVLFDIDKERQDPIGKFGEILFRETYPAVEFQYTLNKEAAYKDVDFVFCQMRSGGYPMRELDEKIPLQMGMVGQETCGAGGFAYGIRSLKDMIEMVEDIRKYSTDAWILNYTNPAAIVAYGLKKRFPEDNRILNICDQPINMVYAFGRLLERSPAGLEPRYFGLNHFGWFTHLYDETGADLLPELKQVIRTKGFIPVDAEQRDQSWLDTYALVQDMVIDFPDYVPSTYLQYYLYPEYKAQHLNKDYTRANEVMDGREKRVFAECRRVYEMGSAKDADVVQNDAHGEMIVAIAEAIATNAKRHYIVMVVNNGIIENLPGDAIVEVTALLGAQGPVPFHVGPIGTFYKGLIENQYAYERLTVEACLEGSYTKAMQALTLNRMVGDAKKARKLLDTLIEANKLYWPLLK